MGWFKRIKEGITTETHQKKETFCVRCNNKKANIF